jgi:ferredoxin-NADP reductase
VPVKEEAMPKFAVTLLKSEQIAAATWAFTLTLPGPAFSFRAGQTIDVTFPHPPHQDASGNRRTFSLAAAPGKDHLLFATRVRGSAFKRSLVEAPAGTALEIEGPFGSFTLPRRAANTVLLAGGIGVTPFRAIVEDALDRRLKTSLLLIHSNRTPDEAPFLDELQTWSHGNPRFVYLPTMTQPGLSSKPWTGERRRVGPELLAEYLPGDRNASAYYVAGPDRFVSAVVDALDHAGVDEGRVRFEGFHGY